MSRYAHLVAALLLFFVVLPSTPAVDSSAALLQTDDALGQQISILGPEGGEIALASVETIQDPFEEYDPAYPPIHGYHFVLLEVYVEATGPAAFQVDPGKFLIRDTDGFLYGDVTIYREEGTTAPDLQYLEVAPGSATAGAVGFQVLNDVTIADILLIPANGQLLQLASFGTAAAPGVLDSVSWIGYEGTELGRIVIQDVTDPFQEYDPGYPPDRGSRYVMLTLTIENTGIRPILVNSGHLFLQDADGFLYGAQTIYQPAESEKPELEYGDLAPGKSASGSVGFAVLKNIDLVRVLYQPVGDRLLTLVDLVAGGASDQSSTKLAITPEANASSVDCVEVGSWLTHAHTEASAVNTIVGTLMVMRVEEDPGYVELAHQVAEVFANSAADFSSQDVPPSVEALNKQLADAFRAYGEATDLLATAVESGDQNAIDQAGQAVYDAEPALIIAVQAVADLAESCGIEAESWRSKTARGGREFR